MLDRQSLALLAKTARAGVGVVLGRQVPVTASFILTNRCNFRCTYCDIPETAAGEMTAAQFCGAIDELVGCGLLRASFSGGEALLRRDAEAIIAHAKGRGLFTSLNTNGWLTARRLERLRPHLDMLVLSLDGPRAVHDGVRRQAGSYDRVVETIRQARAADLEVATITVMGPWNLAHLDDVLDLADTLDVDAFFQPAYQECFSHRPGVHPVFDPEVFQRVAATLEAARAGGRRVAASPGYLERLARGPDFGDCSTCAAGRHFVTVLPDGRLAPCHLTSEDHVTPSGLDVGFAAAYRALPRPLPARGCAIAPYQESDLILGLDRRAIAVAARRAVRAWRSRG